MLALVLLPLLSTVVLAEEAVDLASYMTRLQYFSHKAGLSIQAKNEPLSHFYLHELEKVIERLRQVERYEGYPIGELSRNILEPAFEKLEKSVEAKKFDQADMDYESMLNACNNCHKSTGHNYIKIEKRLDNPFMQSFAP